MYFIYLLYILYLSIKSMIISPDTEQIKNLIVSPNQQSVQLSDCYEFKYGLDIKINC